MNGARITIRLNQKLERRLRQKALASGKNQSELVRDILAAYLTGPKRRESAYDVGRRAGIIGCADGLPPDLSTNKKYLEGMGR